jgi:beta-lactamase regulating signal transducer with metallopeptidase domain
MTFSELPLGWLPIADAVLKASAILAAATGASFALRRSSAALRHLVWTLALCSAVAVPILSLALPKWQLPIVRLDRPVPAPAPSVEEPTATATARMAPPLTDAIPTTVQPDVTTATTAAPSPSSAAWSASITWPQALAGIWLLGAAAVFARIVVGLVAVRWLARRTEHVHDAPWLPMARDLTAQLGITRRPRFLRSPRASMPMATGVFRPAVIMPADADAWPAGRLRIVLLHELAHVKRRDCLTHLLAQAACAVYWFNPLVWVAARRARTERERACDDLVLAAGTRGPEYADQLLEIARVMRSDRFPGLLAGASLAMAHRSQLEGRLIAILDPALPRVGLTRVRARLASVACFCAVAPLGALQPWQVGPEVMTRQSAPPDVVLVAQSVDVPELEPAQSPRVAAPTVASPSASVPALPPRQGLVPLATAAADALLASLSSHEVAATIAEVEAAFRAAVPNQKPSPSPDPKPEPKPDPKPGAGRRQVDPRTVAALTAALKDVDKGVRETALHALVQLRDPAVYEPLVQALKDAAPDVREKAAFGLGELRDRRAVQPLIGALKDENADVREQAAFALGQLRDAGAVDALAAVARDVNADVREQVVFALGQIRDRRAVSPLISMLKDESPDVREQAAFALGQLRDRTAVEALVIAIKDANADVREQVAFALGQLRDERAIEALTLALKDQSADVRQQAAFALGQIAR